MTQLYKKRNVNLIWAISIFILFIINLPIEFGSAQRNFEYEGVMTIDEISLSGTQWTDDMWKFYKVNIIENDEIELTLSYSGSLDLDLRIYIDEIGEHQIQNQDNYAWDITHCGLDETVEPICNSQIRTLNTSTDGIPENVSWTNEQYISARVVYVLIFVYDGEMGSSNYTLTSNKILTEVLTGDLNACFGLKEGWMTFGAAALMVSIGAVAWVRKSSTSKEEQQEKTNKKNKDKKQKSQVKSTKNRNKNSSKQRSSSMKKRGAQTKRR